MSFPVTCPSCENRLQAPDDMAGKRLKCKKCGETFVARRQRPADDEDAPAPRSKATPAPASKARPKPARDDREDDEDEAPRKKPAKAARRPADDDEDEPDEKPRRRSRDDDEDDDRPSKARKGKGKGKPEKKSGAGLLAALIAVGAVVLIGGGLGVYFLFFNKLPGDGLEVVALDSQLRKDIGAGKEDARRRVTGKVLEVDVVSLSISEHGEKVVKARVILPGSKDEGGGTDRVSILAEFPLSDPRNASLKTATEKSTVPASKIRGVVEVISMPLPGMPPAGPAPKGVPPAQGATIFLNPAWVVTDEKPGTKPGSGGPGPRPAEKEDPYTGKGYDLLPPEEIDAEVFEPYQMNIYGEWYMIIDLVVNGQPDTKVGRVFLRPDQQAKISDLWPFQRVRVRGQKPRNPIIKSDMPDYFAAEIVSTGPPPAHETRTAAQLLAEFRADPTAGEKYGDRWVKLTGVVDQVREDTLVLKADGPDGPAPNRIELSANELTKSILKGYKPGQQLTIRGMFPRRGEGGGNVRLGPVLWPK